MHCAMPSTGLLRVCVRCSRKRPSPPSSFHGGTSNRASSARSARSSAHTKGKRHKGARASDRTEQRGNLVSRSCDLRGIRCVLDLVSSDPNPSRSVSARDRALRLVPRKRRRPRRGLCSLHRNQECRKRYSQTSCRECIRRGR
jgi:hypothetical protein